jgi:retinol dehydrogenase-11
MDWCTTIVSFILGALLAFKIYLRLTIGWCKSQTCLVGKTTIVTGANTGIGFETALDFAKRGARVILACRNQKRADDARKKIIRETGNEDVVVKLVDMASFESVRAFAKEINETEDRLDVLVNNAGMIGMGDKKSSDGLPLLMQVNHFSSFLLTNLLIGLLKKSTPSRIVNVSSMAAKRAFKFDIDTFDKHISDNTNYQNSKLCNIFFTKELAKKLRGTGVTTYSLHPGVVETDIFNNARGFLKIVLAVVRLFAKTSEEGAQTTIYCSVAKGIEKFDGEHFSDCRRVEPYATTTPSDLPQKLWQKSQQIVGLKHDEIQF